MFETEFISSRYNFKQLKLKIKKMTNLPHHHGSGIIKQNLACS